MTLVIAVRGEDFVVLGADSRGTVQDVAGNRVELNIFQKIVPINEHVAALMHGHAPAMRYLLEELQSSRGNVRMGVSAVTQRLARFCRAEMKEMPVVARNLAPGFGFLIAGLDPKAGVYSLPRCLGLDSRSGFWMESYDPFAIQGKPIIADYLFARKYKPSLTVDGLQRLVAEALYETVKVDGDVGGRIYITIIRPSGLTEVPQGDLEDLFDSFEQRD